jgi:hypothetical protein
LAPNLWARSPGSILRFLERMFLEQPLARARQKVIDHFLALTRKVIDHYVRAHTMPST